MKDCKGRIKKTSEVKDTFISTTVRSTRTAKKKAGEIGIDAISGIDGGGGSSSDDDDFVEGIFERERGAAL